MQALSGHDDCNYHNESDEPGSHVKGVLQEVANHCRVPADYRVPPTAPPRTYMTGQAKKHTVAETCLKPKFLQICIPSQISYRQSLTSRACIHADSCMPSLWETFLLADPAFGTQSAGEERLLNRTSQHRMQRVSRARLSTKKDGQTQWTSSYGLLRKESRANFGKAARCQFSLIPLSQDIGASLPRKAHS